MVLVALVISAAANILFLFLAVRHRSRAYLLENRWTEKKLSGIEITGVFLQYTINIPNVLQVGHSYIPSDIPVKMSLKNAVRRQRLLDQLEQMKLPENVSALYELKRGKITSIKCQEL